MFILLKTEIIRSCQLILVPLGPLQLLFVQFHPTVEPMKLDEVSDLTGSIDYCIAHFANHNLITVLALMQCQCCVGLENIRTSYTPQETLERCSMLVHVPHNPRMT